MKSVYQFNILPDTPYNISTCDTILNGQQNQTLSENLYKLHR